jgi:hypothetical protein
VLSDIHAERDGSTWVVVIHGPTEFRYASTDARTVVLDLPGWDGSPIEGPVPVEGAALTSLRVNTTHGSDGRASTRVDIRLREKAPHRVFVQGGAVRVAIDPSRPLVAPSAVPPPPSPPTATPPTPAAPTTPPTPTPKPRVPDAARVLSIVAETQDREIALTIRANGRLRHEEMRLDRPERLVVDLLGVVFEMGFTDLPGPAAPVRRARLAQFSTEPAVVRLVIDLSSREDYRVVERDDGLVILISRTD